MKTDINITQDKYKLHFAPLQGYTDFVFRNAFAKHFGGIDVYYTPFIRIEKKEFRKRDLRNIDPLLNNVPELIPQILPGSPEEFRLATDLLCSKGYHKIDINLGCPFPLIAGKRKGSGMLPYPEQVENVLETSKEYPEVLFSVKMRLGWENVDECVPIAHLLNDLRLDHITIHARTGKQQYKGETNKEAFETFYQICQHPLFYNGDLKTQNDIEDIIKRFPLLRGVSIGRGLISSPFIGNDFKENETFSEKERMSRCFNFHQELFFTYSDLLQGETQLLMKMKTLWEYFLPETDRKLLKGIKKANKLSQYQECINRIFSSSRN